MGGIHNHSMGVRYPVSMWVWISIRRDYSELIYGYICIMIKYSHYTQTGTDPCPEMATVTGLPRVTEMSGKNKIFSRSGKSQGFLKKCQGILAIWPMSGNCQGILWCHVRELSGNFIMTLFLDRNFHHMIRVLPGLCLCKCLLGKYKLKVYWLLLLNFQTVAFQKSWVCRGTAINNSWSCFWQIEK